MRIHHTNSQAENNLKEVIWNILMKIRSIFFQKVLMVEEASRQNLTRLKNIDIQNSI